MDTLLFLQNLGLSLLLGGLIGLERERNHNEEGNHEFGGIRTMALVSMFSFSIYTLFGQSPVIFGIFTAGFILLVIASYVVSSISHKGLGATTEVASLFVYLIGILVSMGHLLEVTVLTLLIVVLLYFKKSLHAFARKVEKEELYDTLKFIAIVFVILPLLPNQTFGPLDVLNPYLIWLMVVLISSISFISYIAIKALGARNGIGLGGFLGGLVSSTAVSMSFSQLSRHSKLAQSAFVFGIIIASSAMFFRVLLEVSILNYELLNVLLIPMGVMGVTGTLLSLYFWLNKGKIDKAISCKDLNIKSPFQLWPAIQFGTLFAALLFISKFANIYFGTEGLYLTALVSGFVDVDAITVSMAKLSSTNDISLQVAATSITIAAISNTVVKTGIVYFFASKGVAKRTLLSMTLIMLSGVIALALLPELYGTASI